MSLKFFFKQDWVQSYVLKFLARGNQLEPHKAFHWNFSLAPYFRKRGGDSNSQPDFDFLNQATSRPTTRISWNFVSSDIQKSIEGRKKIKYFISLYFSFLACFHIKNQIFQKLELNQCSIQDPKMKKIVPCNIATINPIGCLLPLKKMSWSAIVTAFDENFAHNCFWSDNRLTCLSDYMSQCPGSNDLDQLTPSLSQKRNQDFATNELADFIQLKLPPHTVVNLRLCS